MLIAQMMRYGTDAAQKGNDGQYLWRSHPMMQWMGNNSQAFWIFGILWLISWILVIAVLIALVRWLWKKGDKVK